jgi:hypothetical protein
MPSIASMTGKLAQSSTPVKPAERRRLASAAMRRAAGGHFATTKSTAMWRLRLTPT